MRNVHSYGHIILPFLIIVLCGFTHLSNAEIDQLTACGLLTEKPRSLLFISTLDGKISALDAADHGKKKWTVDFDEGPMIASNIHRRELNNNGQWVRLIPSLKGGLYKFDGENLEAVPVTTDQLLYSSFRYSDDLVFSGGKETRSYGVSRKTGQILYECNINGCNNKTRGENNVDNEVLIIQHFQQTVRAVVPQSGLEKWNFSVRQQELKLVSNTNIYCDEEIENNIQDIEIKVIVPEGLIWAVKKDSPAVKLWQYKFDSPIVTIWREDETKNTDTHGGLKEVNLFDSSQWIWGSEFSVQPSVYLGMHNRQLYIQENTELYKSLESSSKFWQYLRFPWRPQPAIGTAIIAPPVADANDFNDSSIEVTEGESTTALSVLYNSEYINGNGFYLYSKNHLAMHNQCNSSPNPLIPGYMNKPIMDYIHDDDDDDTPVRIIIVSLWYWWKEVLIISCTTAILLNFILTQRLLNATTVAKDAVLPPLIVERHIETKSNNPVVNETENVNNFKSRYLTDFDPVYCLGKGGYGVVFEAKNKIDDCNYAIKRIALPNSEDSRERVMREVRALAKLDHCNIVRYFNAWLECPPAGWQEKHDQQWICKQKFPPSEMSTELTPSGTRPNVCTYIDVSQNENSSIDSACEAYALNHLSNNNDSFIVFDESDKVISNEQIIKIEESSTESIELSSTNSSSDILSTENNSKISESIIFERINEKSKKKEVCDNYRKSSFSVDLNNKIISRKSTKMFLYIQMQLCQRLSLREWLKQHINPRDPCRVLNIFQQIINAVEYVHLQGLIHRDLKPSNIFFAYDDTVKIGDFGLVTAMTEGYKEVHMQMEQNKNIDYKNVVHTVGVGTQLYMSPEQKSGQIYDYKVDIYSLGIILFELLIPFVTDMERGYALENLRNLKFPENFDINYPAEHNLLKMMLDKNPSHRPTTLGIKARPPLLNYERSNGLNINENSKWHFELPQLIRHSSVTSSSNNSDEY